jgi:glycosyltransferase involved in cell wall biosynthesis
MRDNPVSAVVITYNEEHNISDCLEALKWVGEIVIVDANSQDRTIDLCRKFTDKIHRRSWPGFGPQKNFGIDQAISDWILIVDADERITPALRDEIRGIIMQHGKNVGYHIPRRNFYYGKWTRWGGLYPDYQLRLFKKGAGRYNDVAVHENLMLNGPTGYLKNPRDNITKRRLSDHMKKFMLYTTLAAGEKAKRTRKATYLDLAFNHEATFIKSYCIRQGFRDGIHGFILSVLAGMYTFVKYAKLWEMQMVKGRR